jgi:hypothetical protein
MNNNQEKYVVEKVVVKPDGTASIRESVFESINYSRVWENKTKTLGFYSVEEAQYFVENWEKGMMNYNEAMPNKEMSYVVYAEFNGKIIEDVIFKPKDWKPFIR